LDGASVFPILNLQWSDDSYSKGIAGFIAEFVAKRSDISDDELAAWAGELPQLSDEGRYFFNSSRFIFNASKPI
jgi:hypothetical protein